MVDSVSDSSFSEVSSENLGSGAVPGAPDTMAVEDLAEVPAKLSKWLTLDEWNHMSHYEQRETVNVLENYDTLTGLGINVPKPDFMCPNPHTIPRIDMKKIPVHSTNKVRCTVAPRAGWHSPLQPIQMDITHTAADAAGMCKPSNSGSDAELRNCSTNTIHVLIINMNTCSQQVHGKQDIKCKYLPKTTSKEANIWETNKDGLETTKNNKVITSSLTSDGITGNMEGLEGSKSYNESFSATSVFNREEQIHTGDRPYKCATCNKGFSQPSGLHRHELIHKERPYKCTICNKPFTHAKNLQQHERTHTGERPYKCTTCNKAYSHSSTLRKHERIHTGERIYKCTTCNQAFYTASDVHRHDRSHTGDRPYKCTTCNKSFLHPSWLQRHERIHTGERPYKCTTCNKAFSCTSSLHRHEQMHTGEERSYKCIICNKAFSYTFSLRRHVRMHMGKQS